MTSCVILGNFKEAKSEVVKLPQMSADIFECILHYMYGERVHLKGSMINIQSLLKGVDLMNIEELVAICESRLISEWKHCILVYLFYICCRDTIFYFILCLCCTGLVW